MRDQLFCKILNLFPLGIGKFYSRRRNIFFEMRDKTLRTDEDVLFYLKLPVLTEIPTVSRNGNGKGAKNKVSKEKSQRSSQDKVQV